MLIQGASTVASETTPQIASKIASKVASKIAWRLVPLLMLCYFVAFLDRVNVSFAALTMNADLGFDSMVFGLGAGIFFLGYFVFEVPSNLALARFGARTWIARIMVSWGLVSAAMALVWNDTSFYVGRFLLGAAEAGFFPGVVLYLTFWFTAEHRAKMVGLFMAAVPLSGVIGSPLSGWLLGLDGALGLRGWQWLYVLEGLPAVILSVAVWFCLTDRPAEARWLAPAQRQWLEATLAHERAHLESRRKYRLGEALLSGYVLLLSLIYLGLVTGLYGVTFWLPQIVRGLGGLSNLQVGFVVALPAFAGAHGLAAGALASEAVPSILALSVA